MLEVEKLKQFLSNAVHLQSKKPKWEPLMTSLDEVREQITAAKEAVEEVMTRSVPVSNPTRRSEYAQPSYARGERPEQEQRQRQQQPREPQSFR